MPPTESTRRVAPECGSSTRRSATPRSPICWTTRPAAVSRIGVAVPPTVQDERAAPVGVVIVTLVRPGVVAGHVQVGAVQGRDHHDAVAEQDRPAAGVGTSVVRVRLALGAISVTTVPAGTICTAARSPSASRTPGTGDMWPVDVSMICGCAPVTRSFSPGGPNSRSPITRGSPDGVAAACGGSGRRTGSRWVAT